MGERGDSRTNVGETYNPSCVYRNIVGGNLTENRHLCGGNLAHLGL